MVKKQAKCYLDEDVAEHINLMRKKHNFNLTEWVNEAYKQQFMTRQGVRGQIARLQEQIGFWEDQLTIPVKGLTDERILVLKVLKKEMIEENRTVHGMHSRYLMLTRHNVTQFEFERMLEVIDES